MTYNSQKKERAELLPLLDSPRNTIRAIFSVNALNEGWDVLSLYDIIHFDISPSKAVFQQDIQLIGRGARLCPYPLPASYQKNDDGLFLSSYGTDRFKRKFDNAPNDRAVILETFYYHFVKTGTFLDHLKKELLNEGVVNQGIDKKTITLKSHFVNSETYQQGFILVNHQQRRQRATTNELEDTFDRQINATTYKVNDQLLTDKENNAVLATKKSCDIDLSDKYFSLPLLRKALIRAENGFFRFNQLKKHLIGLDSIDTFILDKKYLPKYKIKYSYTQGKEIEKLSAQEKLNMLVNTILPEVRKLIDTNMPLWIGSTNFVPTPLASVFSKQKNIYLVAYPVTDDKGNTSYISSDERAIAQSRHTDSTLRYAVDKADWYVYSENYGTSEEKRFIKFIANKIDELKAKYQGAAIYVIRNELDYYVFNPKDGRRFSPDFVMIIDDRQNKKFYYQCLFEPKGGHLLEHDKWKEEALLELGDKLQIELNDELPIAHQQAYQQVSCLGFCFYNSDKAKEARFGADFNAKLL